MIYLGIPYSSPSNILMERRYKVALAVAAAFAREQYIVYSPIVHWHACAQRFKLPTLASFWWECNKKFLDCAKSLCIISAPGWESSVGLKQEAAYAESIGLPIYWFDPRSKHLTFGPNAANLRILLGETPHSGEDIPQRTPGREGSEKPN